jgi:hypothetical protein
MSAPQSAQPLPPQTPNTSAPLAFGQVQLSGELLDSTGKPVSGTLKIFSSVTAAWRYLFGTFAQTSASINPNFTLAVSNPPTQAQVEALVAQVALLSKQLGRTT